MGQLPDLPEARRRLELALGSLYHDRWVLGFLRGGCLQPIVSSEITRRFMQRHPLMPLSRKALYERRPMVVNALVGDGGSGNDYDWELDWPALLYAPVVGIGQRPVGLLILGSRDDHWYTEEDVAYAHTLGVTLAPMVAALRRPLSRLNEKELVVAQLLSHGFSHQEIARAMNTDQGRAKSLAEKVARRLQVVQPEELLLPPIEVRRISWQD
jgi:DNA-binding CsgD family transcriptional regulator